MSSVREFYRDKSVLVTGGTGFVGKVLVEKLLRSCPDVRAVYLLLRPKRGAAGPERLRELCAGELFEPLRRAAPAALAKLRCVAGDALQPGLGLSAADAEELAREVQVVVHSAACVRFDQPLREAVRVNVEGTLHALELARALPRLQAFVHVSTAYCRCELPELEERLYPAPHPPRDLIRLVHWLDDDSLRHLEPRLIGKEPNTYSYTKAVTEALVGEYAAHFPVAIARPSIVTCSWREPFPGWVDNLNGPTGLLIGSGKGVIRSMLCEPEYCADAMPVDVVANGVLLAAHATALQRAPHAQVYNVTLSGVQRITWREVIETGERWVNEYPFLVALWYPGGSIKSSRALHALAVLLFHWLPAYACDALLFALGRKPFMVRVQRRVAHGLSVLQYYTTKEWHFRNERFLALGGALDAEERRVFETDVRALDRAAYLRDYVLGARRHVCREPDATLPRARRLHRLRYWLHVLLQAALLLALLWALGSRLALLDRAQRAYASLMQ